VCAWASTIYEAFYGKLINLQSSPWRFLFVTVIDDADVIFKNISSPFKAGVSQLGL
jgi:hypothetical protein